MLKTQIQLDIDTTRCLSEATLTSLPSLPSSSPSHSSTTAASSISNIELLTCLQQGLYIATNYFILPYDMNSLLSHTTTSTTSTTTSTTTATTSSTSSSNTVNNSNASSGSDSNNSDNSNVYSNSIARLISYSESSGIEGTGIDKKVVAKTVFWSRVLNKATSKIKET